MIMRHPDLVHSVKSILIRINRKGELSNPSGVDIVYHLIKR